MNEKYEIKQMIALVLAAIFSIGGYVALFILDWKIALCVFFISWSINIANKYD